MKPHLPVAFRDQEEEKMQPKLKKNLNNKFDQVNEQIKNNYLVQTPRQNQSGNSQRIKIRVGDDRSDSMMSLFNNIKDGMNNLELSEISQDFNNDNPSRKSTDTAGIKIGKSNLNN